MACVIFIHPKIPINDLCKKLGDLFFLNAEYRGNSLYWKGGGLVIFNNKYDAKEDSEIVFPDEYYCFEYYIDFYDEKLEDEVYQLKLKQILEFLWQNNIPAVGEGCTTDFTKNEDYGYNRKDLPWPNRIV